MSGSPSFFPVEPVRDVLKIARALHATADDDRRVQLRRIADDLSASVELATETPRGSRWRKEARRRACEATKDLVALSRPVELRALSGPVVAVLQALGSPR